MTPRFIIPPGAATKPYSRQPGSTSVWLMTVMENTRGKIALADGSGLTVSSNNASVVSNDITVSSSSGVTIFELYGRTTGTAMIEARKADGSVATYLQVKVVPLPAVGKTIRLIRLKAPHTVLNAPNVKALQMTHTKTVPWDWSVTRIMEWVPKDSRHLVFNCHGFHTGRKADYPVVHLSLGSVIQANNTAPFDTLAGISSLRVIWIMACSLAGEGPGNVMLADIARRSGCYVVAAATDTPDRAYTAGCVEDYRYASPLFFTPGGGTISRGAFFEKSVELGFNLVV